MIQRETNEKLRRHVKFSLVLLLGVLGTSAGLTGCKDLGAGGTGEYAVATQRVREIAAVQPESLPVAGPASTQPFVLSTTQPATQLSEVPITLQQVREWALQNNLSLKVDLLAPTIAKQSISEEQARFEAVFTTNAQYGTTDTPFLTTNQQGERVVAVSGSEFLSIAPGVRFPLITGGSILLSAPLNRVENSTGRIDINTGLPISDSQWTTDFTFTFSQPILRGGGIDANLASIRIAFYQYQQIEARTKLRVLTVLSDADRAYWRLYAAIKNLQVRRQEYDLAVRQLERARRRVTAGAVAEVEVTRAESGVADRVSNVVQAERDLRVQLRELKRIINQPGLEMDTDIILQPASEPRFLNVRFDRTALAERAIRDRMEILETELAILQQNESVKLAKNDLLPLLSVQYRYNANGVGEGFDESFDLLSDNDFADHSVGLQLEIPLGNQAARSRLRRALAQRQQQLATRQLREQVIRQEVLRAVTDLETSWQAILAARQAVAAAARVVQLEERQFEQGIRTSTEVLDAQTNLANAQAQEIRAIAEYQIAQIDIALSTGTLLGASNIDWKPLEAPNR
ncbi:MAG TPA: TolC family protein [Tepidisphaeraceae bacterium]|nr:TolC family protein [Tepidisphaeraceae bacterium]